MKSKDKVRKKENRKKFELYKKNEKLNLKKKLGK
jgi:hypothetical protein